MKIRTPDAPIEIQAVVYITDGTQTGKATITFGKGVIPSRERIKERLKEFEAKELPELIAGDFRLLTAPEFFQTAFVETHGINEPVAVPAAYEKFSDE